MLDQKSGEAFVRAQRRAMDDVERMLRAVLSDIFQIESLGGEEVELVGRDGIFGADHRLDHEIDLGSVKRRFALGLYIGITGLLHGFLDDVHRGDPLVRLVDIFFQLVQVGQREAHVIVFDAHQLVVAGMQMQHADELILRLIVAAIDVRIVHAEAAHAHQAGEAAGCFVAIVLPIFGDAQRQLAIGMPRRAIDGMVEWAVHRAQIVVFAVDIERRIHVVLVVRQVPRPIEKVFLRDVRSGDAAIALFALFLDREEFQLLPDHHAVRHP